jgi:hypothetical protein
MPERTSEALSWHWWELVALGALVLLVGLLAAAPISCSDFFWHLQYGRVMLTEGAIPRTDLFSAVHPDAPYVQPQWLWELGAALVERAAGLGGIRFAQALVLAGSFVLLLVMARRFTGRRVHGWFITAIALVLFVDRFRPRPDALTLGFVAASLPLLVEPEQGTLRKRAIYAAILALLWGNIHGGASVLLVLSLGALLAGALLGAGDRKRSLGLFAVVSLGVIASPTMIPGLIHWFTLIGPQIETGNEEWMPTYRLLQQGVTPMTLLIVALPCLIAVAYVVEQVRSMQSARERLGEWLLCGGYLVLSQHAIRNVVLCIVPLLFVLRRRPHASGPGRLLPAFLSMALVAVLVDDVVWGAYGGPARAAALMREPLRPDVYPEEAADFLAEARIEGGIFNEGAWGGYLIARTHPRNHVFVDTRQNLTPEMWRVFLATRSAMERSAALEHAFRRWGVELAVFRAPTFPLLRAPSGWQLLYRAGDQEVFQHLGGAHAATNLERTRRYLDTHGQAGVALDLAAVRAGSARWLARPEQRRTLHEAEARAKAATDSERAAGLVALGELHYRAGLYADAQRNFAQAAVFAPLPTKQLYFAALSSYGAGDLEHARQLVGQLERRDLNELSRRQLERLALLRAQLQH